MKQNSMLAMILAGGRGSRLHDLTNKVAKPAVSYGGKYRIVDFPSQLLLVAALFIHLFINIRPLLVSLGIISYKERRGDIYLILSVLLLFSAGAVIIYYIGWHTL